MRAISWSQKLDMDQFCWATFVSVCSKCESSFRHTSANLDKVKEDLLSSGSVVDFRVELDAPDWLLSVGDTGKWRVLGGSNGAEAFGELVKTITMGHVLHSYLAMDSG
mgnify:CR=1 FL=1